MRIAVHVTPKSGRDVVAGWHGSELNLKVAVPPEGGKANTAACELVARTLGVPRSAVRVVRGGSARHKQLEVDGVDDADMARAFGEAPGRL